MADDVFGDSSLFDEFEKERESTGSFIAYDKTCDGKLDQSKIVFRMGDSEESGSSESESDESENESREQDDEENGQDKARASLLINGPASTNSTEKSTNYQLVHERNKYHRYAKVIDSTRSLPDDESSPACQIIFQNNSFSRRCRPLIEKYIQHLIHQEEYENSSRHMPTLDLKQSNLTCVDVNNKLTASQRNAEMWAKHAIVGCSQFYQAYILDNLGWPLVGLNPSLTDGWEIPKYEQVYVEPLPFDADEDKGPSRPSRPKQSCFNCGGEHMISECKEPKDYARIKQNRDLMKSTQQQKLSSKRYHKEESEAFSTYKPGQISEELKAALGVDDYHLPPYVYKMRLLGYPPGWLEEAKFQSSGLAMFDKDGNDVDAEEDRKEDGEVCENIPNQGQINPDKIIEYPGFTVELPEDVIDEHEDMGFPPLQEHQLKRTLTAQLTSVKRKLEEEEEEERKRIRVMEIAKTQDMDLSDSETDLENASFRNGNFAPPVPISTPPVKPPIPDGTPPATPEGMKTRKSRFPSVPGQPPLPFNTPPTNPPLPDGTPPPTPDSAERLKYTNRQISNVSNRSGRSDSPSLEELEQQYKLLQQKLEESDGNSTMDVELQIVDSIDADESFVEVDSVNSNSNLDLPMRQLSRMGSATSINTFGELGSGSPQHSLPGTPIIASTNPFTQLNASFKSKTGSISQEYGTPIQRRSFVAEYLPDSSKFGEGIMDHIPYENLPDATGAFDKMTSLIKKIREKVSLRKKKS